MAHFVLVHGAFHGSWCWDVVAAGLRSVGNTVEAVDLAGAPPNRTPRPDVTLESATRTVVDALERAGETSVLVGHSMGGVATTQAAARTPGLLRRLVYVSAFRPRDGQSLVTLTQLPEGAADGVQPNIRVHGDPPVAEFDPAMATEVFYHDVEPDIRADAIERLCPQPLSLFTTPVSLPCAVEVPTSYIVCTDDRAIPPALQLRMAHQEPATVEEVTAGHSPFLSCPKELAESLIRHSELVAP